MLGLSLLHSFVLLISILLAACCFSAIGMLLAVPPTNVPSNIMMLSSLIKFPLVFISGIFIPLEQMPPWGLALAMFSPLTYFTDIVRYSFTDTHYFPVEIDIASLAVFTVVFTVVTMFLHKKTMPQRMRLHAGLCIFRQAWKTKLDEEDTIALFPTVAGG